MGRAWKFVMAVPIACLLLAGCNGSTPSYQGPVATNPSAATVTVGKPAEQYSVSQGTAVMQIAAVDGRATGPLESVRVSSGKHRLTIGHHDGYGTFYANRRYADIEFEAAPGGKYRIDGSFCCGFYLGQFDLVMIDESTGQPIAHTLPASQIHLTAP